MSNENLTKDAPVDLMAPFENVQRIMKTGTVWFSVAVGAVAVFMGFLLATGWRPTILPVGLAILWWVAATVVVLSIGLLGWSGCPIFEVNLETANKNKSRTMQLGTLLFILGGAAAILAVLLGPAV